MNHKTNKWLIKLKHTGLIWQLHARIIHPFIMPYSCKNDAFVSNDLSKNTRNKPRLHVIVHKEASESLEVFLRLWTIYNIFRLWNDERIHANNRYLLQMSPLCVIFQQLAVCRQNMLGKIYLLTASGRHVENNTPPRWPRLVLKVFMTSRELLPAFPRRLRFFDFESFIRISEDRTSLVSVLGRQT